MHSVGSGRNSLIYLVNIDFLFLSIGSLVAFAAALRSTIGLAVEYRPKSKLRMNESTSFDE